MDRRAFVRGLFGVAAAARVVTILIPATAEAGPLPVAKPEEPKNGSENEAERTQSDYRPDVDGLPSTDNVQYYYRRRRVFRRRRFYGRPVYRRRAFYRPRRVFYRPRRVFYRPRYIRRRGFF
ncbi:MAG: hypothetical protein ACKVON_09065 [Beijerinckiaceae bacterium]